VIYAVRRELSGTTEAVPLRRQFELRSNDPTFILRL